MPHWVKLVIAGLGVAGAAITVAATGGGALAVAAAVVSASGGALATLYHPAPGGDAAK